MIYGIAAFLPEEELKKTWNTLSDPKIPLRIQSFPYGRIASTGRQSLSSFVDPESQIHVVLAGRLFPRPKGEAAEEVFHLYARQGIQGLRSLDGDFLLLIADPRWGVWIVRDPIGHTPVYYHEHHGRLVFGETPLPFFRLSHCPKRIDREGLCRYLLLNYIPGTVSIFEGVRKLRPGHALRISQEGVEEVFPYWRPSFDDPISGDEGAIVQALRDRMAEAIRIRLPAEERPIGTFLSGGMDSSSIVGILRRFTDRPIHTYSFRCRGQGFDESYYARVMSQAVGGRFHLVEYPPEEVLLIREMVSHMTEPFCDIGIEVATYLLGKEAATEVSALFTGDGGDELFAGHPVYLADRMAQRYERLPIGIRRMFNRILENLPDTRDKKGWVVKAKRFAYSLQFSPALYSNRWRIYYAPHELRGLLTPDFGSFLLGDPLEELIRLYQEVEAPDYLVRSLYGDYETVVQFYLNRLRLLRVFGLEVQTPLLDRGLVDFAMRIPSDFKIRKGETKYILHRAMEGILPEAIVHRKDKLGHSVPFKNWIRENRVVLSFIQEVLSESALRSRGWFSPGTVQTLIRQHLARRQNHSHRLWGLVVLSLWLEENGL